MLDKGMTSEDIVEAIYKDIEEANILDKQEVNYVCDCTRDRYYRGVMNLGKKELEEIFTKDDIFTSTNEQLNNFIFASDLLRKVKDVEIQNLEG
jgi:phospholipid/cholesterol/gamma-HCH transport system ATP-binding protein